MIFPIQQHWRLTTEFYEARPLSKAESLRTHPHAAWDCACQIGTPIVAPEAGVLGSYVAYRPKDNMYWKASQNHRSIYRPFRNYFYDTFGVVYILWGNSGLVHVFAHSYHEVEQKRVRIVEENPGQIQRRPLIGYQNMTRRVKERNYIADIGNAGWSTGPHLHYEIHADPWEHWTKRPDPAVIYPEQWITHRRDLRYDYIQAKERWKRSR